MQIDIDLETAEKITIAYLEDALAWWSAKRSWNNEEKKYGREYRAALKAILKCLK